MKTIGTYLPTLKSLTRFTHCILTITLNFLKLFHKFLISAFDFLNHNQFKAPWFILMDHIIQSNRLHIENLHPHWIIQHRIEAVLWFHHSNIPSNLIIVYRLSDLHSMVQQPPEEGRNRNREHRRRLPQWPKADAAAGGHLRRDTAQARPRQDAFPQDR